MEFNWDAIYEYHGKETAEIIEEIITMLKKKDLTDDQATEILRRTMAEIEVARKSVKL